jgi:hypothetical protein
MAGDERIEVEASKRRSEVAVLLGMAVNHAIQ